MKHVAMAVALLACLATPSFAARTPFQEEAEPLVRNMALAWQARICDLRSERWFQTWAVGYQVTLRGLLQRYHLEDDTSVDPWLKHITQRTMFLYPCDRLANSVDMDVLDRIQWRMTGGYH